MRPPTIAVVMALAACGGPEQGVPDLSPRDLTLPPALSCDDTQVGDAGVPGTWSNVETILDNNCGTALCHYPGFSVAGGVGLDLSHGHAYLDLVNQTATDPPNQCGGKIVTPGDPDHSYLLVKLTKGLGMQCNPQGSLMPIGEPFSTPLPDCEIDIFRRWIRAGALLD